jgi:hypothetical protein
LRQVEARRWTLRATACQEAPQQRSSAACSSSECRFFDMAILRKVSPAGIGWQAIPARSAAQSLRVAAKRAQENDGWRKRGRKETDAAKCRNSTTVYYK